MRLQEIINFMEKIAPPDFKESFDNVGLMVGDKEKEIKKILIALDCTLKVIEEAKDVKAELILTHHPLLFRKPSNITTDTLMGKKIIELIKNDINLYSAHTNWDSVSGGLNDTIVKLMGFEVNKIIEPSKNSQDKSNGIGRIVSLKDEISLNTIIEKLKANLGVENLRYTGDLNRNIKKIAVINGSGEDFFQISQELGADCIITGDTTYHYVSDYTEMGLCIVDVGHFPSEWPTLIAVSEKLRNALCGSDVEIVISKACEDPYKFM